MIDIVALLEVMDIDRVFNGRDNKNWIDISRPVFNEIILVSDEQGILKNSDIEEFLRMVSDEDFIELIEQPFNRYGYINIDFELFSVMEKVKGYKNKPYIFVKEEYFNKLLIKGFIKYEWALKAMAIDYNKYVDTDILNTYKEYFEGNTRIIEVLLRDKEYSWDNQLWKMDFNTNTLYNYQGTKKIVQWSMEEANAKLEYLIKNISQ